MCSCDSEYDVELEVIVTKVVAEDKKKIPYVVTYPGPQYGEWKTITFELSKWTGAIPPQQGQIAILTGVRKFSGGWRAERARPVLFKPTCSNQG